MERMYTDASGFGLGVAVTQVRDKIETLILFDSKPLNKAQRAYPPYKRELLAVVTFTSKYKHYLQYPTIPAIIFTDHRPLASFLSSTSQESKQT
jgi:hypothetical protein